MASKRRTGPHEPSPVALRVLNRVANGYLTLEEQAAPEAMRRLSNPLPGDPISELLFG